MIQSSNSATAYSQKCGKPYVNDFSSSDWLAGTGVHGSSDSRYHRPSSVASMSASVLSTMPSPFMSPLAPPYQICSWAASPNCKPVGSSRMPILLVSTLTVISTESPTATSPTPGTNAGSVVVSDRNGWVWLSMLLL